MSHVQIDPALKARVERAVAAALPEVTAFRQERHRFPELTWKEIATAKAVAETLRQIPGLQVQEGVGRHGVVAVLTGESAGPTVALRADMDALPVKEQTACAYTSQHEGVMHACGHDGHMANLLGSALVLSQMRDQIRGKVKFIFQPAEEGGAGAKVMCDDGALKNPDVDVIFGLHGWPELPCGQLFLRGGAMMAATTEIRIVVRGTGCHAAMPHLGTDQVLVAAKIIEGLQSISSRHVMPTDPVALSITTLRAGTANNVLPATAEMTGTLRTVSMATREKCDAAIRRICAHTAAAYGAQVEVELSHGYPATMNHEAPTDFLEQVAKQLLPAEHVRRMPAPTMGGEDFAFFLERVPGSYFFLGVDDGRAGGYPSLHHPGFDFNDRALPVGMRMFTHAALAYADANAR